MKKLLAIVTIALAGWAATGIRFIQPDEQGVVRRFGAAERLPREPGPYVGLPWGLEQLDRVKPREIKRVAIGTPIGSAASVGARPTQFLTGDRNLVNVRATVQYSISQPLDYLYRADALDALVAGSAEAALSRLLASSSVDHVLTEGKSELAVELAQQLQRRVDGYQLGILVRSVDIASVEPPAEVADAFNQVIAALRGREQAVNQAHSAASRMLAQARADAQSDLDAARSQHDQLLARAEGEAERFEKLLGEYQRSPELTANRLYLETMAATLPRFRTKLIVDSRAPLDLSILREDAPADEDRQ